MKIHKLVLPLLACALAALASCSMGGEASDSVSDFLAAKMGGSIAVALPASQSNVSASVSTGGQSPVRDVSGFEIIVRNSSLPQSQWITAKADPGSTVTIDSLSPGYWSVAIKGFSGDAVMFYGAANDIYVTAGQTAMASVALRFYQNPVVRLNFPDVDGKSRAGHVLVSWKSEATGESGFNLYDASNCDSPEYAPNQNHEDPKILFAPVLDFIEPGQRYSYKVSVFEVERNTETYTGSASQAVSHENLIDLNLAVVEQPMFMALALDEDIYSDQDLAETVKQKCVFEIDGQAVSKDLVDVKALAKNYCGEIPVIATYGDKTAMAVPLVMHRKEFPVLATNSFNVPAALKRKIPAFEPFNPSSPKEWQVFSHSNADGSPVFDDFGYGFGIYGLNGTVDKDVWMTAAVGGTNPYVIPAAGSTATFDLYVNNAGIYGVAGVESKSYAVTVNRSDWQAPESLEVAVGAAVEIALSNPAATSDDLASIGLSSGADLLNELEVVDASGDPQTATTSVRDGSLIVSVANNDWTDSPTLTVRINDNQVASVSVSFVDGGGSGGGGGSGTWSVTVNNGVNMGMIYTTESSFNFYLTNSAYTTTADYEAVNLTNLFTFNLQDAPNQNPPVTSKVTTGDDGNPRLCVTYPKTSGGNTYFPSGMASFKFTVYDKTSGESVCECSIMFMDGGGNTLSGEWSAYMKSTTITQGGNVDIYIKNTAASSYADYQNSSFSSHFKYFFSGVSGVKKAGSNNPTEDDSVWVIKESFENPFGSSATGEQTITVKYDDDVIETFTVTIE